VTWVDEQLKLIRLQHAPRGTFEEYPTYLAEGWTKHAQDGGAALGITSEDPGLLADQDPDDIATIEKTRMKHLDEFYNLLGNNCFNWSMVSYPTPAWAKKVFPDLDFQEIPDEHPIYNQTYRLEGLPKIHEHDAKRPQGFGIFHEGRLLCFYDYESDLSDGWENEAVHNDPPEVRLKALQMGANIIEYAFKN
jgi:hypothetical protein